MPLSLPETSMKVALVHELLTMRGGAERVLKMLADIFPEAPIYTFLYDERLFGDVFPRERVRISRLPGNRLPLPARLRFNHHLHLGSFPTAAEAWDFSEFDLVISSSSAFAHGIITNGKPKHLCYVHSPARYLWDRTHDVVSRSGGGPLGGVKRLYLSRLFHRLRIWDAEAGDRADAFLAASREVKRRIELYWRRDSEVVYPAIADHWFEVQPKRTYDGEPYFLVVSTLADYKRIDLAIHACNAANVRLKIAGTGKALPALQAIAGRTVEFLGHRDDSSLKRLYAGATAVLFPGQEDFGLVPLESMACGTPVIAHRSGGALETVIEGVTGEFFDEQTPESLHDALLNFDHKKYSKERLLDHAKKFSQTEFVHKMHTAIDALMNPQEIPMGTSR